MTQRGRTYRMIRAISGQSHRGSADPRRRPATEVGSQGGPPQMRSAGGGCTIPLTSPRFLALGQFLANTAQANGSTSLIHEISMPARSSPRSNPPMPEKRLPTRRIKFVPDRLPVEFLELVVDPIVRRKIDARSDQIFASPFDDLDHVFVVRQQDVCHPAGDGFP